MLMLSRFWANKTAAITTTLQPHQRRAVRKAMANNLLLAHSMGSGKTLTAIAVADALNKPTTVLTPASLVENFRKEIAKHKKGGPPIDVMSLPTAALHDYRVPKGNTLIIDEAHALRNSGTARSAYVNAQAARAGRLLALTGTPAYNSIENWAPLVNLAARQPLLPETEAGFRDGYLKARRINPGFINRVFRGVKPGVSYSLAQPEKLVHKISPYVDVFDADVEKPSRDEEFVEVPMDPEQAKTYKFVEGTIPAALRWKLKHNLPPSKSEAAALNSFYSGVRQVANTPAGFSITSTEPGAKLREASRRLAAAYKRDPDFRGFVYSNYLDAGVTPYGKLLEKEGIPYSKFTGELTQKQKQAIVEDYNKGKTRVILGSGSASEGLDLKGTSMMQILEPHFNNARLEQVIGRGIRYKSHEHLPKEKRRVIVQRYLSTLPAEKLSLLRRIFGGRVEAPTSIDQYLKSRSDEKDTLMRELKEALLKTNKEAVV